MESVRIKSFVFSIVNVLDSTVFNQLNLIIIIFNVVDIVIFLYNILLK
jgi:hypothetical protein